MKLNNVMHEDDETNRSVGAQRVLDIRFISVKLDVKAFYFTFEEVVILAFHKYKKTSILIFAEDFKINKRVNNSHKID